MIFYAYLLTDKCAKRGDRRRIESGNQCKRKKRKIVTNCLWYVFQSNDLMSKKF